MDTIQVDAIAIAIHCIRKELRRIKNTWTPEWMMVTDTRLQSYEEAIKVLEEMR